MRAIGVLVLAALLTAPAQAQPQGQVPSQTSAQISTPAGREMIAQDVAVLQLLDKVSARTTTLRVKVGDTASFGLITVTVQSCQSAPPNALPEAAAFLEVAEPDTRDGHSTLLFSGWMFASSPALSALEHPIYDIVVLACESAAPVAAQQAPAVQPSPPAPAAAASDPQPAPVD